MKRKDWRNLAGTVMWFLKQAREGHFPLESDDIRRYSIAIFAGIRADILLGASLIAWLSER